MAYDCSDPHVIGSEPREIGKRDVRCGGGSRFRLLEAWKAAIRAVFWKRGCCWKTGRADDSRDAVAACRSREVRAMDAMAKRCE